MMDFHNVLPSLVAVWQKSLSSLKPLFSQRLADSSSVYTILVPGEFPDLQTPNYKTP